MDGRASNWVTRWVWPSFWQSPLIPAPFKWSRVNWVGWVELRAFDVRLRMSIMVKSIEDNTNIQYQGVPYPLLSFLKFCFAFPAPWIRTHTSTYTSCPNRLAKLQLTQPLLLFYFLFIFFALVQLISTAVTFWTLVVFFKRKVPYHLRYKWIGGPIGFVSYIQGNWIDLVG